MCSRDIIYFYGAIHAAFFFFITLHFENLEFDPPIPTEKVNLFSTYS